MGLARISGTRIEAILFSAGQGRRIMTCGISLHLRVRRYGGRVGDDEVLTLAHLLEIQPVVTKQATRNVSKEESKHTIVRAPQYQYAKGAAL